MNPTCAKCGRPIRHPGDALILWNDDEPRAAVTEIRIVHHSRRCDIDRLDCSGGAAYGRSWFRRRHERESCARLVAKIRPSTAGAREAEQAIRWALEWNEAEG
jgi:hypothetical protein